MYKAMDNDENYDFLYLDFSKKFDKVYHQKLLKKIRTHRIDGKVIRMDKNYVK